ncbi:MAG: T9SS type A sorting domain-containing protein [Cytophagales bacterium]|nr:T9SS type A sorting domain-containing protein [Cytophagales bacterium]
MSKTTSRGEAGQKARQIAGFEKALIQVFYNDTIELGNIVSQAISDEEAFGLTGIERKPETFRILISPNPAQGQISITLNRSDAAFNWFLYEITGRIVARSSGVSFARCTVDIESLEEGAYVLKVCKGAECQAEAVVILR